MHQLVVSSLLPLSRLLLFYKLPTAFYFLQPVNNQEMIVGHFLLVSCADQVIIGCSPGLPFDWLPFVGWSQVLPLLFIGNCQ